MKQEKDEIIPVDIRELALDAVYNILEKGAYTNIILDKLLKKSDLAQVDKKLLTEIVNGTIRMLKHLDWVLNLFIQKPLEKQNPWLRNVLRISLYQILFMDKIPPYACVNAAVNMTNKKAGKALSSVTNGVLRNILRNIDKVKYPDETLEYLSVYYSYPEWLVEKWLSEYGLEATKQILSYFNQRSPLYLRNNELKGDIASLIRELQAEGVECRQVVGNPWAIEVDNLDHALADLSAYQRGRFYVQNVASMLAAPILDPKPGGIIMDLCCGIGGKTTHMAEMMNNTGQLEAYDVYKHKLSLLQDNCRRLGISIVKVHEKDILEIKDCIELEGILLDVPCSGLGVLNRRSDSRWTKTPKGISDLLELQTNLIQKAGELVAPGGYLVYSTCTINHEENEDIVIKFLQNNSDYFLSGFKNEVEFFPLDEADSDCASKGMLTIIPGKYNSDGMFYARLRRLSTV